MLDAKSTLTMPRDVQVSVPGEPARQALKLLGSAALLNALLFGLFLAFATPCYETNDDLAMSRIASGFFTGQPSEHLVFTNVLLGWTLRLLYQIWPGFDWYYAYLITVHYVALTALAFLIFSRRKTWQFILLYVSFFLLVEMRILLQLQFTTTAFLAGTCGLLLLVDGLQPGRPVRWPRALAGFCLVSLMGMIREPVAPLLVAMAAPFLLERFDFVGWRRLAAAGLACGATFLALHAFNLWYYDRDPGWAEFRQYNNLRGQIHETRLQPFILTAAPAADWSENDSMMFGAFYFAEPEVYGSLPKMRQFVDRLKALAGAAPPFYKKASFKFLFLPEVLSRDSSFLLKIGLLNAAWCLVAARTQRRRCLLGLLATYAFFVFLCVYLRGTARLPERVAFNLPLFLNAICLYWASGFHALPRGSGPGILARIFPTFAGPGKWRRAGRAAAIGSVVAFVCAYAICAFRIGEGLWYYNAFNRNLKALSRKIVLPLRSLLPAGQKPIIVPLPFDSLLEQSLFFYPQARQLPFALIPSYGWLAHSPIFSRALDQNHLRPYSLSLIDRPDLFFLMEERWLIPLQAFYREHYGLNIRFDLVLNTDRIPPYRDCNLFLYQAHAAGTVPRGVAPKSPESPVAPGTPPDKPRHLPPPSP